MTAYRFNVATHEVLDLAREASVQRNHEYIGPEHILLGLLASDAASLRALTDRLQLDRASIAASVDAIVKRGKRPVPASVTLPFTSRAKRVLELALESASSSGTVDVGAEHLLMGLCAEGRNIAAEVLVEHGVTAERVRLALELAHRIE